MHLKSRKSIMLLVIFILLVSTVLAACSNSNNASKNNEKGQSVKENTPAVSNSAAENNTDTTTADQPSWKADTSPFTFKQYFYGSWATNYLWKDQYAMKLVTDKTGITIDRFLATGNDDDFLNTMIAANDLPDTIMLDWGHQAVSKLVQNGMVYSLSELIQQYAPKLWEQLDPEMVQYHSINGELYYLPNFFETKDRLTTGIPPVGVRPWFIRTDVYEALGKPKVETEQDLLNVIKQASALYPDLSPVGVEPFDVNFNGFKGSRSLDYLIYSFSPNLDIERKDDANQVIQYPMRNEGFREAFRYLNALNKEGLFDPQLMIYKQEQYEEKLYGANYIVASQFMDGMYTRYNPKIESTLGADKKYTILDGIKVNGQEPRYPVTRLMGWQGFFITKNAKNPERIVKFLEYAWSDEGQMDLRYGTEGETYDLVDGSPLAKQEIRDLQLNDNNAWYAKYGFDASTVLWKAGPLWDNAGTAQFIKDQPEHYDAINLLKKYNYDNYATDMNVIEPEGSSPEGVINAKVKDLWNKTIPKLVLAKSDSEFDKLYDDFLKQMDQVGAEKAEKAMYAEHMVDLEKKGLK
jgi:putative aldouronate transport system substrate-binding protein